MDELIARLRSVDISWSDEGELCAEAADTIIRLREALVYARESLGDPVPINRRHVARVIDAALTPKKDTTKIERDGQ